MELPRLLPESIKSQPAPSDLQRPPHRSAITLFTRSSRLPGFLRQEIVAKFSPFGLQLNGKRICCGTCTCKSETDTGTIHIPLGTLVVPNHDMRRFAGDKDSSDSCQSWSHDAAEHQRSYF